MAPTIVRVFLRRRPPQICEAIIRRLAVPMGAVVFSFGRRPDEMLKDEAVNKETLRPASPIEGDPQMTTATSFRL